MAKQMATTQSKGQKTKLSGKKRLALISEVFELAQKEFDSFETSEIGADLAYLFSAIAANGFCEWPVDRPIINRVLEKFGGKHVIWKFIQIDDHGMAIEVTGQSVHRQ